MINESFDDYKVNVMRRVTPLLPDLVDVDDEDIETTILDSWCKGYTTSDALRSVLWLSQDLDEDRTCRKIAELRKKYEGQSRPYPTS